MQICTKKMVLANYKKVLRKEKLNCLMVRIILIYYVNCYYFLEDPVKDWAKMLEEEKEGSSEPTLFD